ncbi:unnamed protein product [Cyprideis torosa]|uniref:Carboxylesterase type B domain-containing protein n=1 Tax=Cyprideis torosa TaxID=163714 RepID=A0A7R8WQU6_9CRUS|nr:unnamed protein product [Cyprideis torosa]CAG0902152.1 unnamed protein product [Cyprideis torosa]
MVYSCESKATEDAPLALGLERIGRRHDGTRTMFSVGAFKKPTYDFALLMASHNVPVWYYSFEYQGKYTTLEIPKAKLVPSGISHNDVVIYLFEQSPELEGADAKFSRFLIKSLYNFYKASERLCDTVDGPLNTEDRESAPVVSSSDSLQAQSKRSIFRCFGLT